LHLISHTVFLPFVCHWLRQCDQTVIQRQSGPLLNRSRIVTSARDTRTAIQNAAPQLGPNSLLRMWFCQLHFQHSDLSHALSFHHD
jgi:hypothetical protein